MGSGSNESSSNSEFSSALGSFKYPPLPHNVVQNRRRYCDCPPSRYGPHVAVLRVSQKPWSMGRIFFSCRHYQDRRNPGCGFFLWCVDEGAGARTGEALYDMEDRLEHAVMDSVCTSMKNIDQKLESLNSVVTQMRQLEQKVNTPNHGNVLMVTLLLAILFLLILQK